MPGKLFSGDVLGSGGGCAVLGAVLTDAKVPS